VSIPMAYRIAVERRLDVLAMLASVQRDHPRHALELVHHDQVVLGLEELHGIGREHPGRKSGGHTEIARLVVTRIAGARFEERLATGFEGREVLTVKDGGGAAALLAADGLGPFVSAAE